MFVARFAAASFALGAMACTASVDEAQVPLAEAPRVVVDEVLAAPPEGGDGPEVALLAREDEDNGHQPIVGPALGGLPFLGGTLVLRPDRTLEMVRGVHGVGSVIDREVLFVPVASSDGEHVAWAAEHGPEIALVVIDREGNRTTAAQGLGSIGAVSFDLSTHGGRRRVAFVAARNGGIAGVWAAHVEGTDLSCLTNCAMRAGQPLGVDHVPAPTEPIVFEGDVLVLQSMSHEDRVTLPEALR